MRRIIHSCVAALIVGLTFAAATASAPAQTSANWPSRPLKFITSFAPGASPDIVCRIVADRVSRSLSQQVLVENRPGASNVIAAQAVARAPADGYTYFFATAAAMVTNSLTFKTLSYDPVKDFAPVALIGKSTFMVLVNPSVAAKDLRELVALDKAHPGGLSFASDGPRNLSGMLGAWLNKIAGMKLVQVAETFSGFDFSGWFGIVAPAGTPEEIVGRMNREINIALKDPVVRQRLADGGLQIETDASVEDFNAFLKAERARWTRVVHDIGIEPE